MDHVRAQDAQQSKFSTLRHKEYRDESVERRPTDSSVDPTQDGRRPIRRVRSPSRPRAWPPSSDRPKFGGRFFRPCFPTDDYSFYKPGFSSQRYHHFSPRAYLDQRDQPHPKLYRAAPKEREREEEKEQYERRESSERKSPAEQNTSKSTARKTTTPFLPKYTFSRYKEMQFTVCQTDRNQSRERDHRGTRSKEREQSRDRDLPLTVSQTAARDRAIQQKRREIDEVYYQECEMFGLVTKMLIEKDPSLEGPIQSSLQKNLRDIGQRCIEAMEKFIEDYDSTKLVN